MNPKLKENLVIAFIALIGVAILVLTIMLNKPEDIVILPDENYGNVDSTIQKTAIIDSIVTE